MKTAAGKFLLFRCQVLSFPQREHQAWTISYVLLHANQVFSISLYLQPELQVICFTHMGFQHLCNAKRLHLCTYRPHTCIVQQMSLKKSKPVLGVHQARSRMAVVAMTSEPFKCWHTCGTGMPGLGMERQNPMVVFVWQYLQLLTYSYISPE